MEPVLWVFVKNKTSETINGTVEPILINPTTKEIASIPPITLPIYGEDCKVYEFGEIYPFIGTNTLRVNAKIGRELVDSKDFSFNYVPTIPDMIKNVKISSVSISEATFARVQFIVTVTNYTGKDIYARLDLVSHSFDKRRFEAYQGSSFTLKAYQGRNVYMSVYRAGMLGTVKKIDGITAYFTLVHRAWSEPGAYRWDYKYDGYIYDRRSIGVSVNWTW